MRTKLAFGVAAAITATLMLSRTADASAIYLAPQSPSLYANNQIGFSGNPDVNGGGAFGVGNTISFSSASTLGTVDLFGYAGGGSLPIELDLYSGSNPNTGTLLGSAQVTPLGNGSTSEVFSIAGLKVPQTLTYVVSIVGNSGSYDDSFVNWQQFTGIAGSPTIGSSGDMWYGSAGSFVVDNTFALATGAETNTLAVQFNAVPEPATWALMLVGLGGLGLVVRSRRKRGFVTA